MNRNEWESQCTLSLANEYICDNLALHLSHSQ